MPPTWIFVHFEGYSKQSILPIAHSECPVLVHLDLYVEKRYHSYGLWASRHVGRGRKRGLGRGKRVAIRIARARYRFQPLHRMSAD